ncbi:MAG: (1-_4)-alpha-D-glucan 1-alpha-D-glucosylmutase [Acidobacteriaceae bacterium]|jgi:(1->4)-alpha-D-glucan 1-alpha-D-glucosylmutase|nr:(1->4)-alpha-D-glucan 1-alpha-D-glucosylmutase [Acidobacteriaceae bacterium]
MISTRVPLATYRLQFNKNFTFKNAVGILDYLRELGITDIYASPILTSRHGSGHGYDVTNPNRLDPDLGTEKDFEVFVSELEKRGMGLLLDIVPNHMAASSENPWWVDVLENGPDSAFSSYFDIDWHPPSRNLDNKILLPILGRPFGEALDSGELKLSFHDGQFSIEYFESSFPLAPRTYRSVLQHRIGRLKNLLDENSAPYHEYQGIVAALSAISDRDTTPIESASDKRVRFESIRERLRQLAAGSEEVTHFIQENIADFNGQEGDPSSFANLQRLLGEQYYVLAFWQNVNETINYRRFFTITDLVGMRVEDSLVFDATHSLILRLISRGAVSGLRIDHIDGLRDPLAYLKRLQERVAAEDGAKPGEEAYVLVEKILARKENLPNNWPVAGTTGYDYLNFANRILVQPEGAKGIERIYSHFIGRNLKFSEVLYQKKKLVMDTILGVEMRSLGRQLGELAAQARYARDLPRHELTEALIETTACFAVYRTYIRNLDLPPEATKVLGEALAQARLRKPALNPQCFDFLRDVLLLLNPPHVLPDHREARLSFVLRWQQFTGPIVAKGLEDTALYVYYPLASLNEVGGDPAPDAICPREFFEFIAERQKRWPHSMNASSTHDTKRAEDVRARISVLSEIPQKWEKRLHQWAAMNEQYKIAGNGGAVPDRNEEYFLYQTLLGMWPLEQSELGGVLERLQSYAVKAIREAMVHTRWTRPNLAHEKGLKNFIAAILDERKNNAFLEDFHSFQRDIEFYGMLNSLSQTLLKITAPGVPDFYQGSELWDLRLVDPDNRGTVDFARRIKLLTSLQQSASRQADGFAGELMKNWTDGRIKLYLISKALRCRQEFSKLFTDGDFVPAEMSGERSENVTAFFRVSENLQALILAPKWLASSGVEQNPSAQEKFWGNTSIVLPDNVAASWRNVLTGESITAQGNLDEGLSVGDALKNFPMGLLLSNPA